jgi:tRNA (uracil-5-)-methyltransferase TRM9
MYNPSHFEEEHVHRVYTSISKHFSQTRYKPWPVVAHFMNSLPTGSVGMDLGAGNCKNALPFPHLLTICLDMSQELLHFGQEQGGAMAIHGTVLSVPVRGGQMDFCICIAVLHHFATAGRRLKALAECARVLKGGGGRGLVFVWAFEPERNQSVYRHKLTVVGDDPVAAGQDVLVPWQRPDGSVEQRYYHLFREGELEELVLTVGGLRIVESGFDRDNYFLIFEKQ